MHKGLLLALLVVLLAVAALLLVETRREAAPHAGRAYGYSAMETGGQAP